MKISHPNFLKLCGGKSDLADKWYVPLYRACEEFSITTDRRQAMFLAQLAHESGGFARVEEGLNYSSAERLRAVWPQRFKNVADEQLARYVKNPRALANLVYANRMGNGSEESGDGWNYRGRGLIQLTGLNNYRAAAIALGFDLVVDPDAATDPDMAPRIAGWFWQTNGCNELADANDFEGITRRINGGLVGLQHRQELLDQITNLLES